MKNDLIQIVGISGCGKSKLLKEYFQKYNSKEVLMFEFGDNLRREMYLDNNTHEIEYYINKIVNHLISSNNKYLVTSHVVHKTTGGYHTDYQYDEKMNSLAYIHIISNPEDIITYRTKDNNSKQKIRCEEDLETIINHQNISLAKTIELATRIGADIYTIHNSKYNLEENLKTMNDIITKYFMR